MLKFWKEYLLDAPELIQLPLDYPRHAIKDYDKGEFHMTLMTT